MIRVRCHARRVMRGLAVTLMAAAMTGGVAAQSPTVAPSPAAHPTSHQVVSDDGRLTLSIPFGAPAQDVALSAVSVPTMVPTVAAYELRPAGMTFALPVTASWTLDPAGAPPAADGDLVWLGLAHGEGTIEGPWAWLDDPQVDVVDGRYAVTGQLSHFGMLVVVESPTRIRGPESIWGAGYAPGRGIPVDLELTLVNVTGTTAASDFSGDWRFAGGYPERIGVTTTVAEADRLAAVWECLLPGATSLSTTFAVREDSADLGPTSRLLELGPAAASFSVTFPVACGTVHPQPNS